MGEYRKDQNNKLSETHTVEVNLSTYGFSESSKSSKLVQSKCTTQACLILVLILVAAAASEYLSLLDTVKYISDLLVVQTNLHL